MNIIRRLFTQNDHNNDPHEQQISKPLPSSSDRFESIENRRTRLEHQIAQEKIKAKSYLDRGNKQG
jgi:hypothetical protein